jgi:ABC-type Fe3+-hydroxamate transport system substrate-binding protein
MASIATLPHLFWKPDVIICNDWQTATVPLIYQQIYKTKEFYDNIKTVLTVHNFDDHATYDRSVYDKLGVSVSSKIKGNQINCYEAAAEDVDLIISLDSPSVNNTKKLLSLPLIKQNKKKLLSVKIEDGDTPNYETTSSIINEELSKHFA